MSLGRPNPVEKYNIFNSLVSIPVALIGRNTFIDLLNNCTVAGTIDDVDGHMNITMTNVVLIDARLGQHLFEIFHVQARQIKLIHIPKEFNVTAEVRKLLDRLGGKNQRIAKEKRTFKKIRATNRQQETLRDLAAKEKDAEKANE